MLTLEATLLKVVGRVVVGALKKGGGYIAVATTQSHHTTMDSPTNSFTYLFPLLDIDDAKNIALITKNFEDEGRLLRVDVFSHDEYSQICSLKYVNDPATPSEPYPYLKYLVDQYASVTIKVIIKS